MSRYLVLIIALLLLSVSPVIAQEPVFTCLDNPPAPLRTYYWGFEGKWMAEDSWTAVQAIEGRPLWVGYDNGGWATAGDERLVEFWEWPDLLVTVWYSPSRDEYEFYPHKNIELYADANGDHYGIHPCGGWAVDATVIDILLEGG